MSYQEPTPNPVFLNLYKFFFIKFMSEPKSRKLSTAPANYFADSSKTVNKLASKLIYGRALGASFDKGIYKAHKFLRTSITKNRDAIFEEIKGLCDLNSIQYFTGGSTDANNYRLNIDLSDMPTFIDMLIRHGKEKNLLEIMVNPPGRSPVRMKDIEDSFIFHQLKKFDVWIIENIYAASNPPLAYHTTIEIDTWSTDDTYSDNPIYSPSRVNTHYSRISEKTFLRLKENKEEVVEREFGDMYRVNFDIDVVFTWVNDEDEKWLSEKEKYLGNIEKEKDEKEEEQTGRAHLNERFKNRDELKYALRSIELFAPFVRNIYIVTANQTPEWLDTTNERVKIISHSDIYARKKDLPTFNSSGIETQLHHIDGLSEHFLYFNDDFMLGQLCCAEDFFYANGSLKFFPSEQCANENDIDETREEYIVADKNIIELFKKDLKISPKTIMLHCPYPSKRSLLYEMEEAYKSYFDRCAANRFRNITDIRPIAFMQYHFGFHKGQAYPDNISHRYLGLWKPTIVDQMNNVKKSRKVKTLCVNDVGVSPERESVINNAVIDFLENMYPQKSSFEK